MRRIDGADFLDRLIVFCEILLTSSISRMNIVAAIKEGVVNGVNEFYHQIVKPEDLLVSETRKEFTGDFTVMVFPFTKHARKKPEEVAEELGNYLCKNISTIRSFNVIKGFLNLEIDDSYWKDFLERVFVDENYGQAAPKGSKVMVEFSSPNTNKPLHLGHIRNILLGWSCSKILEKAGYDVVKVQIVNDRGIAICKSMLAWQKYSDGETPESTGIKGDHFVGDYYVLFEQKFQEEYRQWQSSEAGKAILAERKESDQTEADFFKAFKNKYFNEYSDLGKEAKAMLLKWENNDPEVRKLWSMMNGWVYEGFEETYKNLGVSFDKIYYESDTYILGNKIVDEGLKSGVFYKKNDNSVWIDLEDAKLDHKLVRRSDGTSVYITQDIGTAQLRYDEFRMDKMIYVVGDEQNYHFQVLFEIMKRLGASPYATGGRVPFADGLHHLSYGMVELPEGKMKSREGTVVDADDLIAEVIEEARKETAERGDIASFSKEEQERILYQTRPDVSGLVGMAALKFFIIKVNPQKRMIFNPKESVELQGQTGPYIQYSYVRTKGVLQSGLKTGTQALERSTDYQSLAQQEKDIILQIHEYPEVIRQAAETYDPSLIANYCYKLSKLYHKFYHDLKIVGVEPEAEAFRLKLSKVTGDVLKSAMELLGIEMPERM